MAARTNRVEQTEKTKWRIRAGLLLNRLADHADGVIELTSTQIKAAEIVIRKAIPDLKAIELTGQDGGPLRIIASQLDEEL